MNNNKQLGMVDNLAVDPSIAQTQRHLEADSRPPVDAQAPSIQPLPFEANNENLSTPYVRPTTKEVQPGTVLTDNYYNVSDTGVSQVHSYSHNTSNQAELRMRQEQQRVRQTGRSIYSTPPSDSGFKPYVDVSDGSKATPEQLELLRKRDRLANCLSRLKSLQLDEQRTALKLKGIRDAIKNLQTEVEDL